MSKEMRRTRLAHLAIPVLVACLLVLWMMPAKAHAADLGIDGTYDNTYEEGVETTFDLYKVASYGRDSAGKSIFVLDSRLGTVPVDVKVDINKDDYTDENKWTEDWLNSANALWLYLKGDDFADLRADIKVGDTVTTSGGAFSFDVTSNGLYLLVEAEKPKVIKDDPEHDGADTSYWVRPMFVQVLNGRTEIVTKLEESQAKTFTVTKTWEDTEDTEILRPDSVEVEILFNGDVVETIELSKDNDWTYQWSTEDEEQFDAGQWECREILDDEASKNYAVEPHEKEASGAKVFNITNVFSRYELWIHKYTPEYVQDEGKDKLKLNDFSAVFQLTGIKGGKEVYHHKAGMQIPGPGCQTIYVPNIPRGLDQLLVKEIYAGPNYTPEQPDKGKVADLILSEDKMMGIYTVEFKNNYNGTTKLDGGIVNRFEKNDGKFEYSPLKEPVIPQPQ